MLGEMISRNVKLNRVDKALSLSFNRVESTANVSEEDS